MLENDSNLFSKCILHKTAYYAHDYSMFMHLCDYFTIYKIIEYKKFA